MPGCSANNCNVRDNNQFKLIKVPTDEERRIKWNIYLEENGRSCPPAKNYWLCERHFAFEVDDKRILTRAKDPTIPKTEWMSVVSNKIKYLR